MKLRAILRALRAGRCSSSGEDEQCRIQACFSHALTVSGVVPSRAHACRTSSTTRFREARLNSGVALIRYAQGVRVDKGGEQRRKDTHDVSAVCLDNTARAIHLGLCHEARGNATVLHYCSLEHKHYAAADGILPVLVGRYISTR